MRPLTRGEEKSLALHRWIANRLQGDPALLEVVRRRLEWLRSKNPAGRSYYDDWARLLSGTMPELIAVLVSPSETACALRQESPFVDVVDQKERARIFRAVADEIDGRPAQ
jgi:hypothetical protein